MANYITVDGGTTNTRLTLVCNGEIIARRHCPVGAGSNDGELLHRTVKAGIEALLTEGKRTPEEITCILAAGMITSEKGLFEVPHLPLPAGAAELHRGIRKTVLTDITPIPFCFIPGLKADGVTLEQTDMLRGEEAELMGLYQGAGLYILPGSHSKLITVDTGGTITDFKTMLTGELFGALANHTIIKDAVAGGSAADPNALFRGYTYARDRGLNEALFKVRVLKNQFHATTDEAFSFFLGAVLCDEIQAIAALQPKQIYLGGKRELREPTATLIRRTLSAPLTVFTDEQTTHATTYGMIRIYEENKQ